MQDILQDSPADITDAAGWTLADIAALLGDWIISGFQPTLHFAAQSAGYLLLAGLLGLLVGRPAGAYVEILAVLGFGSLSLSTAMQLTALVGSTAQDCSTYLTAFVPVFGGVAAAGGQTSGALVYSGMFFAMSGFLCAVIRKLLLPVMQIYFCFSVCACLWGNRGITDAAALFARCMHWLLKVCGALFSLVLGLQNTLAATVDNAALRTGKGLLQGAIPVVGDAAAAALTGAAAALQLLKGSLALAGLLALAPLDYTPVLLHVEVPDWAPWASVVYLGGVVSLGGYGLYNVGVSRLSAAGAAAYTNLIPILTLASGVILLREVFLPGQYMASVLVVAGVLLSQWGGQKGRREDS